MRLLIIGGDGRNRHLKVLAESRGYLAQLVGHGETFLSEAVPSDRVVLPFPIAEIDRMAPAPFSSEKLPMEAVCRLIEPGAIVYATKPGPILTEYMQKNACTRIDFTEIETFTRRNAIPSAEGAIHALMTQAQVCLTGQRCLIVGYGRIGRALAQRLYGLGARVTVAARSTEARALAEGDGYDAIPLSAMAAGGYRFLLNTVPALVIDEAVLRALAMDALVIDLASPPYGIDLDAAEKLSIRAWREPGLPGRYAPETAAWAMLRVIEEKDGA